MSLDLSLKKARFVILDTETTGDPPKAIELGAVEWIHGRKMAPSHFQETFIDPQEKLNPAAQAVHHITEEDLVGAPLLEEVEQAWGEWVDDAPIVAYNSDFDRGVLSSTCMYNRVWVDAWRAAMHVWYIGQRNEDDFPLTSFKQQELRYWLKLPKTFGDAHRAAADVQVTAHLLSRIIDVYLECGNPDSQKAFIDWVNAPIQHLTLPLGGQHYAGKKPEELADWALKRAFDPTYYVFEAFAKFDVHHCLLPEYQRRFGSDPAGFGRNKPTPSPDNIAGAPTGSFRPGRRNQDTSTPSSSRVGNSNGSGSGGSRWTRSVNPASS